MENVAHTLLGAALGKTRLGHGSPLAPVALAVAANLPDFENLVLAFCDRATNMVHHRGITHALAGILVLVPLFTLLTCAVEKLFVRGAPGGSFWCLLPGVALATASHPLLDWLNTYGWRPWLPFDHTRYHGDLVFIVDPWLWLLLGGAVCLAGRRTRAGSIALAVLAILLFLALLVLGVWLPWPVLLGWATLAAMIGWARWRGWGQRRADAVVLTGLLFTAGYVGLLGWTGRTAGRLSTAVVTTALPPGETIVARTLSPQFGNPLRWQVVTETHKAIYRHDIALSRAPGAALRLPKRLDDPLVRQVVGSRPGAAWRQFARHPVAAVARNGNGRRVYLLDARYGVFPARGFSSVVVDVAGDAGKSGDGGRWEQQSSGN